MENETRCTAATNFYGLTPSEILQDSGEVDSPAELRQHPDTGETYCLTAIVHAITDPDWNVRAGAAWALGNLGDIEGVVPLVAALKDENREVRDRAHEALEKLDSPDLPLMVRALLCNTVTDATRTDILLALSAARSPLGSLFGYGSIESYCTNLLEQESVPGLNEEERKTLERMHGSARAVLNELSRRSDSKVLLRSSSANDGVHSRQLLRSANHSQHEAARNELLRSNEDTHEKSAG